MASQNAYMTMTSFLNRSISSRSVRKRLTRLGSGLLAASLSLSVALPTFAADPFRPSNPYNIGDLTEDAFIAIFQEGDYVKAQELLNEAEAQESGEPMVYAMQASMAYLENDLPTVAIRADETKDAAQALLDADPQSLRGHLYTAVGVFLEGAHLLATTENLAQATPTALGLLQEVFESLDEAEKIDSEDSELNLLKGYMDLMVAVNLPFSNPDDAISRMQEYGSPEYLAQRGIAIGYRDLSQYDNAIAAVDTAISAAPNNPELFYLKAQILKQQGDTDESLVWFNKALEYSDQLPAGLLNSIIYEHCIAEGVEQVDACFEIAFE
ncbi:MAG: Sll0314/Alr1548 family TPR repeat-containing protein [Cyanobacteria bacterium J06554_3]